MVVAELIRVFKMTLPAIFSILNNVSIRRNICLNFRKFKRENKPLFWQKWTPDVFFLFPAAIFVSLGRTQNWRLHTKLYKFVWNIMSNNSSTEYRTDLRLGQSPYLFIIYNVSISWLHSVNGFRFLFWWHDSENRQYENANENGEIMQTAAKTSREVGICAIRKLESVTDCSRPNSTTTLILTQKMWWKSWGSGI